jgi:predicted HD phosphohydrolase
LAQAHPEDRELQVAGLVHDIGHRLGPDDRHGVLGAEQVRGLLGERVAGLVEAHVPAKRYLVTTDASYSALLSTQSTRTLDVQGGVLTPDELTRFVSSAYAADAVELRRADDAAKVPGRAVAPLRHWVPILEAVAAIPGEAASRPGAGAPVVGSAEGST